MDHKKKQEQQKAFREEKEMKKQEEENKRKEATEVKRQKAIDAYNNMQKKLKARNVTSVVSSRPVVVSGGAKKAAVTSSNSRASDPHAADKEMCRSLIVLCDSMVPSRKGKKKKKVRLVYRADSFVKFNHVGVKIPKYAKDLPATITALNSRIASYDEEVPTKEVVVEEEETPKEEATEGVEVTSENQI